MDLDSIDRDLAVAARNAEEAWRSTREIWRDASAEYFERRFWKPLQDSTRAASDEMSRVAGITRQVRRRYRI